MILNDAGEMVVAEWNRIPERNDHVVLDKYQIMPNHLHGILQIISLENGRNKPFENGSVGTSFMGVLNDDVKTIGNGCIDDEKSNENRHNKRLEPIENKSKKDVAASERTPIKDVPTLCSIIGGFKSISTTNYAKNVRQKGWSPFRKRLWQLRCHDHIIRNEEELNRIRQYIEDNSKNWVEDENNPVNIREMKKKDS